MGKYDEAKEQFERLLKMTDESTLSQEIKNNTKLFHHYNLVTVALGKKDTRRRRPRPKSSARARRLQRTRTR
jgi:hypothetical protein